MARTDRTPLPAVIQAMRDQGQKWCHGCAGFHPLSDFGPDRTRPDGLDVLCRPSRREKGRQGHARKRGDAYRPRICEAIKDAAPDGMTWCNIHASYCPTPDFGRDPRKANGLQSSCVRGQVMKKTAARNPPKRITSKYNPAPEGSRWCWWHKAFEPASEFYDGARLCKAGQREKSRTYPETNAAKERNRRARRRGNGGRHTGEEIVALGNRQGWKCGNPLCLADIRTGYDADHIMPLNLGGSDDITNIWLMCIPCNRKKSDKHPIEWALSLNLDPKLLWPHLSLDQETPNAS